MRNRKKPHRHFLLFEPPKRFGQSDFKSAFVELSVGSNKEGENSPTCHGDRFLDKLERLWYNHAPNINGKTFPY